MAESVARLPDVWYFTGLANRYFTTNLAEAGKSSLFWKSVPEGGILKINRTQNFSNYNDISNESSHDSSFNKVNLGHSKGKLLGYLSLSIHSVSVFLVPLFSRT